MMKKKIDKIREADKPPKDPKDIREQLKEDMNTIHNIRKIRGPVDDYNGDLYFLLPDSNAKNWTYIKVLGSWCGVVSPGWKLGELYGDDDGVIDIIRPGDVNSVVEYSHNYNENTKKAILRIYDKIHDKVMVGDGDGISTPEAVLKPMEKVLPSLEDLEDFKPHDIVERLMYYVYLGDGRSCEYYVLGAYVILTYIHRLFDIIPNLIIRGEKGAGKGHFLGILSYMVWNPSRLTSPSPASVYRHPEERRGTLLIDEGHRILNMPGETGQAIKTVVESGNQKGYKVPRYDDGKRKMHEPFCPKIITTNYPMELEDKSIVIIPPKLRRDREYGIRYVENDTDPILQEAQYNLVLWCLWNYKEIIRVYKENKEEMVEYVFGRYSDLWRPLLSIIKVAFPEAYPGVLEYARKDCEHRIEMKEGKEVSILKIIKDLIDDGKTGRTKEYYKIRVSDINDELKEMGVPILRGNAFISMLENMKISYSKGHRTGEWRISKEDLKNKFMEVLGESDEGDGVDDVERINGKYQEALAKTDFEKIDELAPKIPKEEPATNTMKKEGKKIGTIITKLSMDTKMTIKECGDLLLLLNDLDKIEIVDGRIIDYDNAYNIAKQHISEYETIKNLLKEKGPLARYDIARILSCGDPKAIDPWINTIKMFEELGWLQNKDGVITIEGLG